MVQLTITPEAIEKLSMINEKNYRYLLLSYDTEGCGCGVNGVPTIRFTNKQPSMYINVENDMYPTIIHKQQAIFFAENIKLDVVNEMFRLSSPEGILNPFIPQQAVCEK